MGGMDKRAEGTVLRALWAAVATSRHMASGPEVAPQGA